MAAYSLDDIMIEFGTPYKRLENAAKWTDSKFGDGSFNSKDVSQNETTIHVSSFQPIIFVAGDRCLQWPELVWLALLF